MPLAIDILRLVLVERVKDIYRHANVVEIMILASHKTLSEVAVIVVENITEEVTRIVRREGALEEVLNGIDSTAGQVHNHNPVQEKTTHYDTEYTLGAEEGGPRQDDTAAAYEELFIVGPTTVDFALE